MVRVPASPHGDTFSFIPYGGTIPSLTALAGGGKQHHGLSTQGVQNREYLLIRHSRVGLYIDSLLTQVVTDKADNLPHHGYGLGCTHRFGGGSEHRQRRDLAACVRGSDLNSQVAARQVGRQHQIQLVEPDETRPET